jgi:hypothetical protein
LLHFNHYDEKSNLSRIIVTETRCSRNYQSSSPLRSTVRTGSPMRCSSPNRLESSIRSRLSPLRYTSPNRYRSPVKVSPRYISPLRSQTRYYSPKRIYSPIKTSPKKYEVYEERSVDRICLEFKDFVKELIFSENELDRAKTDLALRSDFNMEHAFRQFEKDGRGYITDLDFKFSLKSFDLEVSLEDIKLLFKRYDLSNEGCLKYLILK